MLAQRGHVGAGHSHDRARRASSPRRRPRPWASRLPDAAAPQGPLPAALHRGGAWRAGRVGLGADRTHAVASQHSSRKPARAAATLTSSRRLKWAGQGRALTQLPRRARNLQTCSSLATGTPTTACLATRTLSPCHTLASAHSQRPHCSPAANAGATDVEVGVGRESHPSAPGGQRPATAKTQPGGCSPGADWRRGAAQEYKAPQGRARHCPPISSGSRAGPPEG